jgi:membrane protease YdiL (CAAX protease family)
MVLGAIGDRLPLEPVAGGSRWARVVGVLLVALAWTYPHFLDTPHAQTFLYAAPMGLVPCPTLALVAGIGLLTGGLRSPSWSLVVAGVTLFYGLFGALRLGVYLDGALVIAAVALAALALRLRRGKPSPEAGPPLPDDARASS